jgi:hypothetical protein
MESRQVYSLEGLEGEGGAGGKKVKAYHDYVIARRWKGFKEFI